MLWMCSCRLKVGPLVSLLKDTLRRRRRMAQISSDSGCMSSELRILATLKHPNIVAFHESFFDDNEEILFIVQDYCDGGTLENRIHGAAQTKEYFDEKQIMHWFIQITMAIQYIHSLKILHRDLKSQNVFMKTKGNVCKIGDFGVSKQLSTTSSFASSFIGSPCCLPPEMCQGIPYSSKADVWALGCVLYEMCALKYAFDAMNTLSMIFNIVKKTHKPIPKHFSDPIKDLINRLLNKNPDQRPSAGQVLQQPYVQSAIAEFISYNTSSRRTSTDIIQRHSQMSDEDMSLSTLTTRNVEESIASHNQPHDEHDENTEYEDDFESWESMSVTSVDNSDPTDVKNNDIEGGEDDSSADIEEITLSDGLDEIVSCARVVHEKAWMPNDVEVIHDDEPIEIRQLLRPHCEEAIGRARFDAIVSRFNQAITMQSRSPQTLRALHCEEAIGRERFDSIRSHFNQAPAIRRQLSMPEIHQPLASPSVFLRSNQFSELCYFVEELYGSSDC